MKKTCCHLSHGFALISVLALVSLAALTATAFLASARLERQATRSLSQTVQLEMALTAGEKCADQTMGDSIQPSGGPNFVTTLYRGPGASDWTNEGGYLFIGQPNSVKNLKWTYYAGFSPATLTNLDSNNIESFIRWTNSQQGAFSNEIQTYMNIATNGFSTNTNVTATSKICTLLPLLGGRTSPPVGWVYLYQDKRIPGTTNTTNIPVARCAWFMEDLCGLIDAERMGGLTTRNTGTNPEEISLANMTRPSGGTVLKSVSTMTNSRKLLFTPGLLANPALSGLTNTNDLRYFATGLREWRPTNATGTNGTVTWIPGGIFSYVSNGTPVGYKCSGYLKMDLNRLAQNNNPTNIPNIVQFISDNLPNFTNRAGGMDSTNYLYALAANIIDYLDQDSTPTTFTNKGVSIAGFDNYPLPTIIFDQMSLAGKTLTVNSYWQFWNCSTATSPAVTYNYSYDFADTLGSYTRTSTKTPTAVSGSPRIMDKPLAGTVAVPALNPGCSAVTRFTTTTNLESLTMIPPAVPASDLASIWIDGTTSGNITTNNSLTLTLNGKTVTKLMTGFERKAKTLANGGTPVWSGGMPGLRYDNVAGIKTSFKVPPSGDPRMLLYLTNNVGTGYLSACDYDQNVEWELGYAQTRKDAFNGSPYSGMPGNWPDGTNSSSAVLNGKPYPDAQAPSVGTFTAKSMPSAVLSTTNLFTNICELGSIFDPIQWVSTSIASPNQWVDCDISGGTTWTPNSMYGGGQTLRIGRPEHSRFAFTNLGSAPSSQPIPNTGQSAAALLDLFCLSNPSSASANGIYRTGGKINLNTAPGPVLAALAGGISLTKDSSKSGSEVNATMISAFTNGVMRFRSVYPFLTPSHLAFISANYGTTGWTNSAVWTVNAVFSTNGGLRGITGLNDEGREEWFSKIYELSCVSSVNYRFYIAAQLVDTNRNGVGPVARKYCQYAGRPDTTTSNSVATNYGIDIFKWGLTTGQKKVYESPY
jgi:hypothetical protein